MLMEVYVGEKFDKLDDWIENISARNKIIEGLHEEIQWIKDKA